MIYLKPVGGLCNRMKAIDSVISLCEKYKHNLTVLWAKDAYLGCSYERIFTLPKITEIEFNIVDCPESFPEYYIRNFSPIKRFIFYNSLRQLKRFLKRIMLSRTNKEIIKSIHNIPEANIILNEELTRIYQLKNYPHLNTRETDNIFLTKTNSLLKPLLENRQNSIFISSCFRLYPIKNNYTHFVPTESINKEVQRVTKKFDNTIGVHIRRNDQIYSIKYSTTDKFIQAVQQRLKVEPSTTFFLSTDDNNVKEEIMSEFGEKIFTNDVESYDRNKESSIINAAIDLFCLSKTKQIYGSAHSTFSQTAADIGNIEEITIR